MKILRRSHRNLLAQYDVELGWEEDIADELAGALAALLDGPRSPSEGEELRSRARSSLKRHQVRRKVGAAGRIAGASRPSRRRLCR